jgi:hypothetical protein
VHLTFGWETSPERGPNVRRKSYMRDLDLLVFLMVLTFARKLAGSGGNFQNRNTSTAVKRVMISTWDTHRVS